MKKSNKDRLSELPESLIFHILWFVPIKDVVRTTVLSKRWKNLWTTIPFFNLKIPYNSCDCDVKFGNFASRALARWNGNKVMKFKIESLYFMEESTYVDTELWLNFAKDRGVEELCLDMAAGYHCFDKSDFGANLYSVPLCLYSCLSLKMLSFKICNFSRLNGNVQWNHLKSLTITECFGVTEHVVNQILSGSPRLEVLDLSLVDKGENLNIRSNSLKELLICKSLYDRDEPSLVSELTVWAPVLETLRIKGMPYGNCRLENVSSLSHAVFVLYGVSYNCDDVDCDFPEIGLKNGFLSSQDYIGDKFNQILQTIQHVENITLFYCCHEVLEAIRLRCKHSSFPNVKSLKIGGCFDNYEQLVGFLEIFPQLERLVLQDKRVEYNYNDDPEVVKYEANIPESFLQQLRTIEITWTDCDGTFLLSEILLKYASKLEKMVFRVGKSKSQNSLLLASKTLLYMPRSSTNFTVDFQPKIFNDRYPTRLHRKFT